jgi:DNA-binding GntR family transcriptional regulator
MSAPENHEHLHTRIANDIRRKITNGVYPPGARLPSVTALAAQHEAALGTVKRALADLREEGVLEGRRGSGVYVPRAARPPQATAAEIDALRDEIADLRQAVEELSQKVQALWTRTAPSAPVREN